MKGKRKGKEDRNVAGRFVSYKNNYSQSKREFSHPNNKKMKQKERG
jgi:hypothetical protein